MAQDPSRILVRGVNWLGDAVMTTPALVRLRERFPKARITLLTHEKLADLWLGHAAIDEVMPFASAEGPWCISRRLRAHGFELALILPNSPRSALESWLAGVPQRIGYARPWRNWLLTRAEPTRPGQVRMRKRSVGEIKRLIGQDVSSSNASPTQAPGSSAHQIHEYLGLAAAVGADATPVAPQLHVLQAELAAAAQRFGLPIGSQRWFGLNAGAEYGPAKRWPVERFVAAAAELQRRTDCRWLIFGGKNEVDLGQEIFAGLERKLSTGGGSGSKLVAPLNLAGKTSLRELCALLKLCRVLVTNDSGPMHVAAALGTPVVVPFGSTSAELTGPGLPGDLRHRLLKSNVACSPCFQRACPIDFRCMEGITIERMVEAVLEVAA